MKIKVQRRIKSYLNRLVKESPMCYEKIDRETFKVKTTQVSNYAEIFVTVNELNNPYNGQTMINYINNYILYKIRPYL